MAVPLFFLAPGLSLFARPGLHQVPDVGLLMIEQVDRFADEGTEDFGVFHSPSLAHGISRSVTKKQQHCERSTGLFKD
jgi:hypothetical protein